MTLETYLRTLDGYSTISLYDQNGRLIEQECTIKSILKWLTSIVTGINLRMFDQTEQNGKVRTYINLGITIHVDIPEHKGDDD
jgi:hypothetical protein